MFRRSRQPRPETRPLTADERTRSDRPGVARALAGPLLIVAAVLVVLHGFVVDGLLSIQYPDVLPFWLPTYCHLGKSLAAGHIPAWNPHVMGGLPFAADPQSGWMYAPPMLLFASLPCHVAIRWFIAAQPIIGGLGLYAFLRSEGASRPASTVGGLALAMPLAGSYLVLNLPFAGVLAWMPVMLAAASRYLRATSWAARLAWAAAVAFAWGQVAAASLSDGLVIGTAALVAYAAAVAVSDLRAGRRSGREIAVLLCVLLVTLPALNLASLLPRLAYLPRTSIGLGYRELYVRSLALSGGRALPLVYGKGYPPTWPLRLALTPGAYLGASALALMFAGLRSRTHRGVVIAFAAFGAVCYTLMLESVANMLPTFLRRTKLGSFYFHDPSRFRFGLLLSLAVLAGLGVEAWLRARTVGERVTMLVPGVVVWGVLPWALDVGAFGSIIAFGAALGLIALTASARRPAAAALVPAVLVVELCANGLAGQSPSYRTTEPVLNKLGQGPINTLTRPAMRSDLLVRPSAIASALARSRRGRFVSVAPDLWDARGYHVLQRQTYWGLLAMQQSMLFDGRLEEAQGYNPAQPVRYWAFLRAAEPKEIRYNGAYFIDPPPIALDLLQVAWVVGPRGSAPVPGAVETVRDGEWALYRLPDPPPRASVVSSWGVAASSSEALQLVLSPSFDPERRVVLEDDPRLPPSAAGGGGTASYTQMGPQEARILVDARQPSIVLIRNTFDPNWHATVDGRAAPVMIADSFVQAVAVPAGRHEIRLTYDDPWVGYGLASSGMVILLLCGAIVLSRRRERRLDSGSQRPPSARVAERQTRWI